MTPARAVAVALLATLALAGCGAASSHDADNPATSTLRATWVDRNGDGTLERGPGEPMVARTELAPASRPVGTLATLAFVTDLHVRDAESPARASLLDRLGPPFSSTFRPQEALSGQVLAGAVRAIDAAKPTAVIEGGDLIDNDQADELDQALRSCTAVACARTPARPATRARSRPPTPTPPSTAPRGRAAVPRPAGAGDGAVLLPGLRAPWYPVPGNHDLLVEGEVPPTPALQRLATGDRRLVEVDRSRLRSADALRADPPRPWPRCCATGALPGRSVPVAPDPDRRLLSPGELVARLRGASAAPKGGGAGAWTTRSTPARGARHRARRDRARPRRLRAQPRPARLAGAAAARGRQPLGGGGSARAARPAASGRAALALLDRDRHVVAALSGDTHKNRIAPRRTAAGGYWLISTGSLADWPMQARMLRLVRTADGGVALQTWMLDTAGGPASLPGVARQLAFLDAQGGRPQGFRGTRRDRNAVLYLPRL